MNPIASLAIANSIAILIYSINQGVDTTVTSSIVCGEHESIRYNRLVHTDSVGDYINVYGTKYYLHDFMRLDF